MMNKTLLKQVGTGAMRTKTTIKSGKYPARIDVNVVQDIGENALALGILIVGGAVIKGVTKVTLMGGKKVVNHFASKQRPMKVAAPVHHLNKKEEDEDEE